jgi:hypothetical protein
LSLSNSGVVKDDPCLGEGEDPELTGLLFELKGHIAEVGLGCDGRLMSGLSADSSKEFGSGFVASGLSRELRTKRPRKPRQASESHEMASDSMSYAIERQSPSNLTKKGSATVKNHPKNCRRSTRPTRMAKTRNMRIGRAKI